MNMMFLASIVISVVCAGACYLSTLNIFLSLLVLAAYAVALIGVLSPLLRLYSIRMRKSHECYRFVNSFLISLSATCSLERAFLSAGEGSTGKLRTTMESVASMEAYEKTRFLGLYFESDLYAMFLSVLELYSEQGGDVLKLSASLLEEVNRVEESNRKLEKTGIRNAFQYILLWAMSLGILVFLRFGLGNYFDAIRKSAIYLICISVFFFFMLGSILLYGGFYVGGFGKKKKSLRNEEVDDVVETSGH